jgi:hypothetical protein
VGPADRWDPRDRETESRDELVAGESRRQCGLRGTRGHLRVPHLEANLLTYLAHALRDSRVLAVANGGTVALRGVTTANLGNDDAVEVADEQE